ncbi:MAG: site-specific integrase, partial [Planctomycetes bacterium]|nr:site-specific integrase [Planctomycetota bacterium]
GQLCLKFLEFAADYYRSADGKPTTELQGFRYSLKPLCEMFRTVAVTEFGPGKLDALRDRRIERGLARTTINQTVGRIKRVVRWGVSREFVRADVLTALNALDGLKAGRSRAVEPSPVEPVLEEHVDAIKPFVTNPVWAMVRLQWLTGMRACEVRIMRSCDVDQGCQAWEFVPRKHKTQHRGRQRRIYLGPQSQMVLRPFLSLSADPEQFLFRPIDGRCQFVRQHYRVDAAVTVRNAGDDNTPYTHHGYDASIRRACKKAGVTQWSPGRLRHSAATRIRKEFGDIEAARVCLGHADPTVTTVYAQRDFNRARELMLQFG